MRWDRQYLVRLAKLTAAALAAGLVGGLVGYMLLASALYTHAFTHPGCGEMGGQPTRGGHRGYTGRHLP